MEPRPYGGRRNVVRWRWTKGRVVEDADPYGLRRGRAACHRIIRVRDAAWELVKTPPPAAF